VSEVGPEQSRNTTPPTAKPRGSAPARVVPTHLWRVDRLLIALLRFRRRRRASERAFEVAEQASKAAGLRPGWAPYRTLECELERHGLSDHNLHIVQSERGVDGDRIVRFEKKQSTSPELELARSGLRLARRQVWLAAAAVVVAITGVIVTVIVASH
jgi:hypothetical protein